MPTLRNTLLATIAGAMLAAAPVHAQVGSFIPADSYWMGPFGSAGVGIISGQIWVDVNGNGLQEPGTDTYHPIPSGLATGWVFRLTPSRRIMVAFTSNGLVCPGSATSIRLYTIPTIDGANLVQLGTQQTLAGCIQDVGFFDDPGYAVRTAYFREPPDVSGNADILWWDLVNGGAATSPFPYSADFGFVDFAPSGSMAWVQHGINAPSGTNYSIVTLCPPTLGQASQPGLTNQTEVLRAHVEQGTPDLVVVARNGGGTLFATFDYDDCALPPPVVGACCLPGGGCLGGTTQGECETDLSGTWQGAASTCSTAACPPPPLPEMQLTKVGPSTAEKGLPFDYTLTASNVGNAGATNVVVLDSLPAFLSFVSASNGGTWNAGQSKVTWNLGSMGSGAVQPLMLTVKLGCGSLPVVNDTYRITADGVGTTLGSPAVTTTPANPPATPLQIAIQSQALAATPLGSGDRVRHTFTMTNTLAQLREGLTFQFMPDVASTIVQIVDDGGGTLTGGPLLQTWVGSVGPSTSVSVVWETEITECRSQDPATEIMNRGVPMSVRTACFQSAGFAFPTQSFPVAGSPFALRLESTTRPAQTSDGSSFMTVGRPGEVIDFEMRFLYSDAAAPPACGMSLVFPAGLTAAGNPPFIGTPPTGTTWDSGTQTIAWTGQPPANDSVVVAFSASLDNAGCLATMAATASHGSCTNFLNRSLAVAAVAQPPAGPHLIGLQTNGGLYTFESGGTQWEPLMCGTFTTLRGVGRTSDGTLWVAGDPTFSIHPGTLAFQLFNSAQLVFTLQMDTPFDAAGDPGDGTVVFTGYQQAQGLRVRRYDPGTGTTSQILNDTQPQTYGPGNSVGIGADGFIGVQAQGHVLRIDPGNPPAFQAWTDGSVTSLGALALDTDGNYLAVDYGTSPLRLLGVDRVSGAFTPLFDFAPHFSAGAELSGVAVNGGDVYAGSFGGEAIVLHRAQGNSVTALPAGPPLDDLLFVDTGTVSIPPPAPAPAGAGPLALAPAAPNPFASATTLRFTLPGAGEVRLEFFDLTGRRVRTLVHGILDAGAHSAAWDGRGDSGQKLRAGMYFAQLGFGGAVKRTKVVVAP